MVETNVNSLKRYRFLGKEPLEFEHQQGSNGKMPTFSEKLDGCLVVFTHDDQWRIQSQVNITKNGKTVTDKRCGPIMSKVLARGYSFDPSLLSGPGGVDPKHFKGRG